MAKRDPKDLFEAGQRPKTVERPAVSRDEGPSGSETQLNESLEMPVKRIDLGANASPVANVSVPNPQSTVETAPDLAPVEEEEAPDVRSLLRATSSQSALPSATDEPVRGPSSSTMILEGSVDDLPKVASETVVRPVPPPRSKGPSSGLALPPHVVQGLIAFFSVVALGVLGRALYHEPTEGSPPPLEPSMSPPPAKKSSVKAGVAEIAPRPPGTVKIISDPPAQVFIGGRSYGPSPIVVSLPGGTASITLEDEAVSLHVVTTIEVVPGRETLSYLTIARGRVEPVAPAGTRFIVDGKSNTTTPLLLWPGPHRVEALLPNGRRATRSVEVVSNATVTVEFPSAPRE